MPTFSSYVKLAHYPIFNAWAKKSARGKWKSLALLLQKEYNVPAFEYRHHALAVL